MNGNANIIDSTSVYSIERSLKKILNLPLDKIKKNLKINIEEYEPNELLEEIYNIFKDELDIIKLDGLIMYHMTRLSDEMKKNIEINGLKPLKEVIDDWVYELFVVDNNIDKIKNDLKKMIEKPDYDYMYSGIYINGNNISFMQCGPDIVAHIFRNRDRYFLKNYVLRYKSFEDYIKCTRPYFIKIYVDNSELENLAKNKSGIMSIIDKEKYYVCLYLRILCYHYAKIINQQNIDSIKFKTCNTLDVIIVDEKEKYKV